jgi:zinc and cadmium transporter
MDAVPHPELLNTLLALGAISAASLLGSVSFAFGKRLQILLPYLLAVAGGILVATALTHLLPESVALLGDVAVASRLFLLGLLGSFLLERALSLLFQSAASGKPLAASVLLSGAVHSFVDGVAIAVAFAVGHEVGVATTLAVFLHEVPHHVVDVGVLIFSGLSRWRATALNLVATSGCAVGGVFVLAAGLRSAAFTYAVLPIAAANFLYIGLAILIPEMQRETDRRRALLQMICFTVSAIGMTALSAWEPA